MFRATNWGYFHQKGIGEETWPNRRSFPIGGGTVSLQFRFDNQNINFVISRNNNEAGLLFSIYVFEIIVENLIRIYILRWWCEKISNFQFSKNINVKKQLSNVIIKVLVRFRDCRKNYFSDKIWEYGSRKFPVPIQVP